MDVVSISRIGREMRRQYRIRNSNQLSDMNERRKWEENLKRNPVNRKKPVSSLWRLLTEVVIILGAVFLFLVLLSNI